MRLLLVEDEVSIVLALRNGLEQDGFAVDVANDGATGLWMARENTYGVILLDLMLPEMDGWALCKTLRHDKICTPILMLTAKGEDTDIARGLTMGADDYLAKPFSYVVLLARIRALLRRPRAMGGAAEVTSLEAGRLHLNASDKKATVDGANVVFTEREFCLLETLVLASGRVLSKGYLLTQVWGDDFSGAENIVEVYIGYLRRKLAPIHCADMIQTIRGRGYRFSP